MIDDLPFIVDADNSKFDFTIQNNDLIVLSIKKIGIIFLYELIPKSRYDKVLSKVFKQNFFLTED